MKKRLSDTWLILRHGAEKYLVKKFKIFNYTDLKNNKLYKKYRLTLDYKEDFFVIWSIFNKLYKNKIN